MAYPERATGAASPYFFICFQNSRKLCHILIISCLHERTAYVGMYMNVCRQVRAARTYAWSINWNPAPPSPKNKKVLSTTTSQEADACTAIVGELAAHSTERNVAPRRLSNRNPRSLTYRPLRVSVTQPTERVAPGVF